MLEWWFPRISRVRDGDHIPMGPEMLPENGVVGFADFAALGVGGQVIFDSHERLMGSAYNKFEIFGKSKPEGG